MAKTKSRSNRDRDDDWGTLKKPRKVQTKPKVSRQSLKKMAEEVDEDSWEDLMESYRL